MISFDLKCAGDHVFEVWFRSSEDYDRQLTAKLVLCPICGDQEIMKSIMAPAIGSKGNQQVISDQSMVTTKDAPSPDRMRALVQALAEAQSKALAQSQWVGESFAEKARAMHYGEADIVPIHGTANARDARAMLEEGLAVAPLLVPIAPPDQTN